MRLALIAPGRSGKSHAAQWLAANTPLRYTQSTSQAAAAVVYADAAMRANYQSVDECWGDRHRHRQAWRTIILSYNCPDKTRLYREMLDDNDILDGIRCREEFEACREARIFDVAVWIDRDVPEDPSLNITPEMCDARVNNHGELAEFEENLGLLCEQYGILVLHDRKPFISGRSDER